MNPHEDSPHPLLVTRRRFLGQAGIGIGIDHGWLGHTGELPGYNCAAYYFPPNKAVMVVMVNTDIPVGKTNPAPTIMKALAAVITPDNVPE